MSLKRIESAAVEDRRVLVSIDTENILDQGGNLVHDHSLRQAVDTIELLQDRGASIFLISQAGSPKRPTSFVQVAERLSKLLKIPVPLVEDPLGAGQATLEAIGARQVLLLENLYRYEGEAKSDKEFAERLAQLADAYVNEAAGCLADHHASLLYLPRALPSSVGIECHRFLETIRSLDNLDSRPLVLLLGGKQVARQCSLIARFLERVSIILLGGASAYTFMKSRALPVGNSLVEKSEEVAAFQMIEKAELAEAETILPLDHVVGDVFSRKARTKTVLRGAIPDGTFGLDIGPKTIAQYEKILKQARTILWYGPMGATEFDKGSKGTKALAKAIAKCKKATTVAMGRETLRDISNAGQANKFTLLACGSTAVHEILSSGSTAVLDALSLSDE